MREAIRRIRRPECGAPRRGSGRPRAARDKSCCELEHSLVSESATIAQQRIARLTHVARRYVAPDLLGQLGPELLLHVAQCLPDEALAQSTEGGVPRQRHHPSDVTRHQATKHETGIREEKILIDCLADDERGDGA